jgi:hypothetical protein
MTGIFLSLSDCFADMQTNRIRECLWLAGAGD